MTRNRAILTHSNRIFFIPRILLPVLFVLMLCISCNSDSTVIGESLQPPSELIRAYHLDDFQIEAFTLKQDSMITSNAALATVGSIRDDDFGSSSASFLFRVRLDNLDFAPGSGAVADSLVLTLLPDKFYGDELTRMSLTVYRLNEDVLLDSVYYSNKVPVYDTETMHIKTIGVTDTLIRFVLDTTFFLDNLALAQIDTIDSNEELRGYFQGVYVTTASVPVEGEGAILLLDLLDDDSEMTMYYHNATDTLDYDFIITATSARVNMFSNNYTLGEVKYFLENTPEDDSLIFVQGMAGTYARIDIPSLDDIKELGDVALNKAELTLKIYQYEDSALYPPPEELILLATNDDGDYVSLLDSELGEDYFGGTLDEETGEYSFTITNFVKDYLTGDNPNSSLYLFVGSQATTPNRVILSNSNSPNNIQLRIIYTML